MENRLLKYFLAATKEENIAKTTEISVCTVKAIIQLK